MPPEAPSAAGAGWPPPTMMVSTEIMAPVLAAIDAVREGRLRPGRRRQDRRDRQAAARRARASRRRRSWRFKGGAGLAAAMACRTARSDVASGSDVLAAAAAGRWVRLRRLGFARACHQVAFRRTGLGFARARSGDGVVAGRLGEAGGGAGLEDAQGAERLGELLVDPRTVAGEGEQALQAGLGGRVFLAGRTPGPRTPAGAGAAGATWRRPARRPSAARRRRAGASRRRRPGAAGQAPRRPRRAWNHAAAQAVAGAVPGGAGLAGGGGRAAGAGAVGGEATCWAGEGVSGRADLLEQGARQVIAQWLINVKEHHPIRA